MTTTFEVLKAICDSPNHVVEILEAVSKSQALPLDEILTIADMFGVVGSWE